MRHMLASVVALAITIAASGCATTTTDEDTESSVDELSQTIRVTCESIDHHYESCDLPGVRIKSVKVKKRLSRAKCKEGESFGHGESHVWVAHGCRAELDVKVEHLDPPESHKIRVLSGSYGLSAGLDFGNVTHHVRGRCNGRTSCKYRISTEDLGDPAVGVAKDYLVEWLCGDTGFTREIYVEPEADGREIELTCDGPLPDCGRLEEGRSIPRGRALTSCDGRTKFVHQTDGNLVLYHDGKEVAASHMLDWMTDRLTLVDGNLVQTVRNGNVLWESGTPGHPGANAIMQDDCDLILVDESGHMYWHTNTAGCVEH